MTSAAKHTAGPWKVELIGNPRVLATDAKGDFPICDIRGWGHLTWKGHGALGLSVEIASGIQEANARLIAAAPELLEALRVIADSKEHDGECVVCDFDTLQSVARSAIAKAEGGAA